MFRTFTTLAILALTVSAAQAGDLSSRIHDAAVAACASERVDGVGPASHYRAIADRCVERIANAAMARHQAEAQARAGAKLANN